MRFYKAMLWKKYFDQGYALTSYPKYLLAVVGIGAAIQDTSLYYLVGAGLFYGVICLVLGRLWFHFKLVNAEMEVSNVVNPFVQEMRKVYKVHPPK